MKYSGGKYRSAKSISSIIREAKGARDVLVSPFCGGLAVEVNLVKDFGRMELSDASQDLILMWQAISKGWVPPGDLTEDQYRALRNSEPSALRGFAGFGASFGGKWFGGYGRIGEAQAHRNGGSRTCAEQSTRTLAKDAQKLALTRAGFRLLDYRDINIGNPESTVIYADPPYAGTLGYAATGQFDAASFWRRAQEWSEAGAMVFVSEERAPVGWTPVWEATVPGSMDHKKTTRREALYVLKNTWRPPVSRVEEVKAP